jgi:precorrin-6B methylase 2
MKTSERAPQSIVSRIAIFFIKKISNYFWEIADTWSYKNEKVAAYYNKSIGREYKKEYEECHITPDSNVLHIGCGAYPLTEIMLTQYSVRKVVGIDKNRFTVQRAQEVIRRRHLEGKIFIEYGDGLNYPVKDFDAIIVSSCSLPKVQILEYLFTAAKPPCQIIVREVDIATCDILKSIEAHPDIKLEKCMRHNPFPFFEPTGWTTYCLRKQ